MTPEQAIRQLVELSELNDDCGLPHRNAEDILLEVLLHLNQQKVVKAFMEAKARIGFGYE